MSLAHIEFEVKYGTGLRPETINDQFQTQYPNSLVETTPVTDDIVRVTIERETGLTEEGIRRQLEAQYGEKLGEVGVAYQ